MTDAHPLQCLKCDGTGFITTGWHIYPITRCMAACDCEMGLAAVKQINIARDTAMKEVK